MKTVSDLIDSDIRRITIEEKEYYCASDIGDKLGFSNIFRDVGNYLGHKIKAGLETRGGVQQFVCVDEFVLERLIELYERRNRLIE